MKKEGEWKEFSKQTIDDKLYIILKRTEETRISQTLIITTGIIGITLGITLKEYTTIIGTITGIIYAAIGIILLKGQADISKQITEYETKNPRVIQTEE